MCLQFRQQLMVVSLLGPLCYPRSHKPPTRPAPPLSLLLSLFFHVEQLVDIHLNSEVVYQNSTSFHFQGHILAIRHYGLDQGHVAGDKRLSVSLSGALVELWLPVFFFFSIALAWALGQFCIYFYLFTYLCTVVVLLSSKLWFILCIFFEFLSVLLFLLIFLSLFEHTNTYIPTFHHTRFIHAGHPILLQKLLSLVRAWEGGQFTVIQ